MIQSIIKRDGRVVLYDQNKIAAAILRALEVSGDGNAADAARVANDVQRELEGRISADAPNIELIQDTAEKTWEIYSGLIKCASIITSPKRRV